MAEHEFRAFYGVWLQGQGLSHGPAAREAFAAAHPALCGRDATTFHRGYASFLTMRALLDSEAAFARYCAPRWRLRHLQAVSVTAGEDRRRGRRGRAPLRSATAPDARVTTGAPAAAL